MENKLVMRSFRGHYVTLMPDACCTPGKIFPIGV